MSFQVDWQKNPLIAAVAQDSTSKEVLMLAWMDQEALHLTLETGFAHYFSRSKQRIWKKGESSGHTQEVVDIRLDCDSDAVVMLVKQEGVACHTGRKSCFYQDLKTNTEASKPEVNVEEIYSIVNRVYETIESRKTSSPESSYVAKLMSKGENSILKKVVEEAGEFSFAVKDSDAKEIIYEATDLLFHTLVALSFSNISPDRIRQELARREGLSGIEEKKGRGK